MIFIFRCFEENQNHVDTATRTRHAGDFHFSLLLTATRKRTRITFFCEDGPFCEDESHFDHSGCVDDEKSLFLDKPS